MKKKVLSTEEIRENSYEYGLPEYLQQDLDAFKEGLKNSSSKIWMLSKKG